MFLCISLVQKPHPKTLHLARSFLVYLFVHWLQTLEANLDLDDEDSENRPPFISSPFRWLYERKQVVLHCSLLVENKV